MAKGKAATASAPKRRFVRAKLTALGVVLLAAFVGVETGYAGWGYAHLMAKVWARDESLLKWVPPRTTALVVVDPHLGDAAFLGGPAREAIGRLKADLKKTMGIDLALDVDKAILTPTLLVARGRFNAKKIGDRLVDLHYVAEEHGGLVYFLRQGEDAVAIIEDDVLLYGDDISLKAAIDAKDTDQGLQKDERVLARLKSVGWDHPLVASLRVSDDKPSVRDVLSGASGPRAVTMALGTKGGVELAVRVEAASPTAAQDLKKTIEERAKDPGAGTTWLGADLASALAELGKRGSLSVADGSTDLTFVVRLDTDLLERLERGAGSAPGIDAATKDAAVLRLFLAR